MEPQQVTLTQGKVALVSPEDFPNVIRHKWCAVKGGGKRQRTYAQANIFTKGRWQRVLMHRFILGLDANRLVDHEDGDGLNNQRSNLREATRGQNQHNCGPRGGRSRFKGVTWHKKANKWLAQIMADRKYRYLGLFEREEDAAKAYDVAAKELHGEFARTNF